jgi:hypothetical protein
MEDLTIRVKVSFERLTGLLPLAPTNSYWGEGDLRSPSDHGMRRSGAVGHQMAAVQ